MPSQNWQAENARSTSPDTPSRPTPGASVPARRVERAEVDTAGAFSLGVGDTVTLGFLDELGGFVDALGGTKGRPNIWNSDRSFGSLLDENIDRNREILGQAEDESGGAFLAGQILGGFVPFLGWGGRTVKGVTVASGAYGAAYGFGSGEDTISNRLTSAATFGATGALGGYILSGILVPAGKAGARMLLRKGKDVSLDPATLPSRKVADIADDPLSATPLRPDPVEPLGLSTGVKLGARSSVSDEAGDGVLVTARELLGEPGAARKAIEKRLGKMTGPQAQRLMEKLEEAEATGAVVDNPHYRSLLGLDLSDEPLTTEQLLNAAELFEEATQKLAEKAGIGPKTVKGMTAEVGKELKKGVTLADLEDAFEQGKRGYVNARIAQHVVFTTTAKVIRLRTELLPEVLKGTVGARDRLAEELTDAAHRFTLARGIMSNAGRTLGILSHGAKAKTVEVADDIFELADADAIRKRVDASMAKLGDAELAELLARVRTLADADKLEQVLLNPENAEAFSVWTRSLNTVSLFLRSNALTPATAVFNAASMVLHDFFRNDIAKRWAAGKLIRSGKVTQGLALQMERQAARAVYWSAHKRGLDALVKRVNWEFWTDVERIASVGWGSGVVAAKAKLKRTTMLADGFVPPELREFRERVRLNVTDTDEFNRRIADARGDTALGNLVYHLHRARAVAANTLDATGSASMKLFTGAIDDWGREFIRVKETYAQATRFAVREALEADVPPDALAGYVEKRAKELAELPTAELMQRVDAALVAGDELTGEAAFLADLNKAVEREADEVLFMDGPQTEFGKKSASFLAKADRIGLVLPYIKTPIRLFEQGVVNYGPFGKASREVRDILARGKRPNATEDEKLAAVLWEAKVEVGTQVFNAGLMLGLAGVVTATNGGFENSGNLDAGPPNRINFPGGAFIEYGRMDPFAFTLGMGAMLGQAWQAGFKDGTEFDQEQALRTGMATAFLAARDSILDKSYLKGAQELAEVFTAQDGAESGRRALKIVQGAVARMIPMAGIGRQANETFRSSAVESVGFMDEILRHIPGAGYGMAPRIDPLGDEVKGRTMGINFGMSSLTEGEPISPVKSRLRELGIDISTIRSSDPDGFKLTSEELSEVRRIRAKEAVNAQGLTMHEALEQLFDDPWFQSLPSKDQQRAEVVETMREFNKPAWDILMERSDSYAAKKTYHTSLSDYLAAGMRRDEARRAAEEDVEAYGLPTDAL